MLANVIEHQPVGSPRLKRRGGRVGANCRDLPHNIAGLLEAPAIMPSLTNVGEDIGD
jgi:hypothetical protein